MESPRQLFRTAATDRRVWGLTALFVGWPAFGLLTRLEAVLETATPLLYVYLSVLNAVVPGYPGDGAFWAGFVAFWFVVAAALVGLFDWARARTDAGEPPASRATE
jgi:hypothetical protein